MSSLVNIAQETQAPHPPRNDWDQWWRSAVIYQVYPRSFADGNGDGVGDLAGVTRRLDYLQALGIDAVWFSPFYRSPQVDAGYDVSDYFDINPEYGTLAEFEQLLAAMHDRGLKCVIDVVPNHCSDQHPWFQEALAAGPGSAARERFWFRHSPGGPPNNWQAMFGGGAWEPVAPHSGRADDQDWWYLHLFAPEQPDWNWDHPAVHRLFTEYFRFWLDKGVDGFRVDVAHALVKAPGLPPDPGQADRWARQAAAGAEVPATGPMWDQDGVHQIYREWRAVLDEYGRDRMLVAECWLPSLQRQALYVRGDEMSQAFNFEYLLGGWGAARQRQIITQALEANNAVGAPTTWVLSNHDQVRHATKYGYDQPVNYSFGIGPSDPQPDVELGVTRARAASLFMMGLPGSAYIYQGEELGLGDDTLLADEARQDPTWARTNYQVRGRDGCRIPLPWDAQAPNLGFSSAARTWLPIPASFAPLAAASQETDPDSTLHLYRAMLAARRHHRLGTSDAIEWLDTDPQVAAFRSRGVVVAINTGPQPAELPVSGQLLVGSRPDLGAPGSSWNQAKLAGNSAVWISEGLAADLP